MKSFIQEIIDHLQSKQVDWKQTLIIFPNRRPAPFFKKALMDGIQQPTWSPEILAIDDFVKKHAKLQITDKLSLMMELWKVYEPFAIEHGIETSIDDFFPIGETLLSDFETVDKHLINTQALFANVAELRELEERFEPKEQILELQKFWAHFSDKELSAMKAEFRKIWQQMGNIYSLYHQALKANKMAYPGMAARILAESKTEAFSNYKHFNIAICGFNALSKAEKIIFNKLEEIAEVSYLFDVDQYYLNNAQHEAGFFQRENQLAFKNGLKAFHLLETEAKNLEVIGVSGLTGMAQVLGLQLDVLPADQLNEKTAIVLADENGLQAVLSALPVNNSSLNITMGYPIWNSPYTSLFLEIIQLQANAKRASTDAVFYHKDVIKLLQNPLLSFGHKITELANSISRNNLIYVSSKWMLQQLGESGSIFKTIAQPQQLLLLLKELVKTLSTQSQTDIISKEILSSLYKQFNRIDDIISEYQPNIEWGTFYRLLKRILKAERIPFEGEPLKGLQLMGFLETRSLDFDNVYILSLNEGIMPKGVHYSSLIPFGIRKTFGLNTYQEDDAIYAYHFYRLLQRAKNIKFLYNTDSNSSNKGEPSRYILQLKHELLQKNPSITWAESVRNFSPKLNKHKTFRVEKSDEIFASLAQYVVGENGKAERPLSPSALVTFLKSPLQFYYRYVANLKEQDEVLEDIDPITLGQIVHGTLEALYKPHLNVLLDKKLIEQLKKQKLDLELENQLKTQLQIGTSELLGKNVLLFNICKKLCENVLDTDAETSGLRILQVEFDQLEFPIEIETEAGKMQIMLKGQFDRLDEVDGIIRIVDYKTGVVNIPASKNIAKTLFNDAKNAAAIQAIFYSYVYLKHHAAKTVLPVIYHLKSSSEMVLPVLDQAINIGDLDWFETELKLILEQIWSREIAFELEPNSEEEKYLMVKPLL